MATEAVLLIGETHIYLTLPIDKKVAAVLKVMGSEMMGVEIRPRQPSITARREPQRAVPAYLDVVVFSQ